MNIATLKNNNEILLLISVAAPICVIAIGLQALQPDRSAIPAPQVSQQEILIKQAKDKMQTQYQTILKTLNTVNLNPKRVENPGLEQATILNLGLQLQQAMLKQIRDPNHPNYRQSKEGALFRAIVTNATQLLLASEIENPTTKSGGVSGIVLSYYSQVEQKQVMLRMPPEMLKVIAQAYAEALITQTQISSGIPVPTTVKTQVVIEDLQKYADAQLEVSAYENDGQMVSQLQDLNNQLKTEKEVNYYVDLNGGVYADYPDN